MKFFKGIIYILNVFIVILTVLAYVAPYIDPSRFWALSFFGLIYPYLLLSNVLFIFFWFFRDKKKVLLSLIVLLIGYQNINKIIAFHKHEKSDAKSISILSYNLNQGYYLYKNKINRGVIKEYINEQNVGILLLQEINHRLISGEFEKLDSYPYTHTLKYIGVGIYSKYPIINKGQIDFNLKTNSCLWADIVAKGDTFRVYSLHFQSNQVSKRADVMLEDFEKEQRIEPEEIREILARYKRNVQKRALQVHQVINHIKKSPYPIIAGGDFNDPSTSYTYQQFSDILKDSFREKGRGLGISYAGSIPFLRIDFIFGSRNLKVVDFQTLKGKYSDHFAVKSIIQK